MTRVSVVVAPDMELWVTGWLREQLAGRGLDVQVSNKEPVNLSVPLTRPLIVVRDDSGRRLSHVSFDRSLGITVLGGSRMNDAPANDLARLVMGLLTDDSIVSAPGSPVAAVQWSGCFGPYPVADTMDVARRYGTVQYTIVGSW